jgi:hypothetical protein
MTADITRAAELAESLRAMRRNAKNAYVSARPGACHSITMDSTRLGDLSDTADVLEKLAAEMAEIRRLNAPAAPLTDEQIKCLAVDKQLWLASKIGAAPSSWSNDMVRTSPEFQESVIGIVRAAEREHGIVSKYDVILAESWTVEVQTSQLLPDGRDW